MWGCQVRVFCLNKKQITFYGLNRKWSRYWKFWSSKSDLPGATLKKTMAHSSGVIGMDLPFGLSYNFDLRYKGQYISKLRDYYELVDGGKSDNLGVIPLVERNLEINYCFSHGKRFSMLISPSKNDMQKLSIQICP